MEVVVDMFWGVGVGSGRVEVKVVVIALGVIVIGVHSCFKGSGLLSRFIPFGF